MMVMMVVVTVMMVIAAMPFIMFGVILDLPVFPLMAVPDNGLLTMGPVRGILPDMLIVMPVRLAFIQHYLISMVQIGMVPGG